MNHRSLNVMPRLSLNAFSRISPSAERCTHCAEIFTIERLFHPLVIGRPKPKDADISLCPSRPLIFLYGVEEQGVTLVAHGAREHVGDAFAHDDGVAVAVEHLLVGVAVAPYVASADVGAVALLSPGLQRGAVGHHVGPYLVDVRAVGVVHHVGGIAAGRAHVHLKGYEVAGLAQSGMVVAQAEELEVDEAVEHAEGLDRAASQVAQSVGHALVDGSGCLRS